MNTKKYALIVFALIAAGLIYYFTQSRNTIEDEFDVALTSSEGIDKISLNSPLGAVELTKVDDRWEVNGQGVASQTRVDAFLSMLQSLTVSSPITGSKGKEILDNIIEEGTKVICYKNKEQVYQVFYVSNPRGLSGNYIYKPGNKYLVQLINKKTLKDVFSVASFEWQSKTIFSVASDKIKEIVIDWSVEMENFTIRANAQGGYSFFRDKSEQTQIADPGKIKYYTYEFANVLMSSKDKKYKVMAGELLCTIKVTDNYFNKSEILLYHLINADKGVDKNNLVVHLKGTEVWGKVAYLKMSPLLKKADFFMKH